MSGKRKAPGGPDATPLIDLVRLLLSNQGYQVWTRLESSGTHVELDVALADRSKVVRLLGQDEELANRVVLNGSQLDLETSG